MDEEFFNIIDSEEKAYFLGMLMSDGCVSGNTIRLQLNGNDVDGVVEKKGCYK
jgi:hypothetical protein